jgi:hypothetical protein
VYLILVVVGREDLGRVGKISSDSINEGCVTTIWKGIKFKVCVRLGSGSRCGTDCAALFLADAGRL